MKNVAAPLFHPLPRKVRASNKKSEVLLLGGVAAEPAGEVESTRRVLHHVRYFNLQGT